MGEAAEDLINGSIGMEPTRQRTKRTHGPEYDVSITHLRTGVKQHTKIIVASNKADAIKKYRKKYATTIAKYDPEQYGLKIELSV